MHFLSSYGHKDRKKALWIHRALVAFGISLLSSLGGPFLFARSVDLSISLNFSREGKGTIPFWVRLELENWQQREGEEAVWQAEHILGTAQFLSLYFLQEAGESPKLMDFAQLMSLGEYVDTQRRVLFRSSHPVSVRLVATQFYQQRYGIQGRHFVRDVRPLSPQELEGPIRLDIDEFFVNPSRQQKDSEVSEPGSAPLQLSRKVASDRSLYGTEDFLHARSETRENHKIFDDSVFFSLEFHFGVEGPYVLRRTHSVPLFKVQAVVPQEST